MKSNAEEPSNSRPTLVKVGRRSVVRIARRLTRQWWSATAESYFGSVSKARILDVVREAISPDVASALARLKKGELVKAAEERLAGKGWLPASLRVNAS